MADAHFSSILATIRSGEFSDLRFLCNDKAFFVHKNIVCTQSSVLKSTTKVSSADSAVDTISMECFEIPAVESFVQFLYTGDYAIAKEEGQDNSQQDGIICSELLGHIRCHHIASSFKVDKLASLSRSKLEALLDEHKGSSDLGSALPAAVRLAHTVSASQDVVDLLAASVARNMGMLMGDGILSNISNAPEFLLAVLTHSARNAAQIETDHAKRIQELTEKEEKSWAILKRSIQLLHDTKLCRNNFCQKPLNAELTDTFELTCRACHSNQDPAILYPPRLLFGGPVSTTGIFGTSA